MNIYELVYCSVGMQQRYNIMQNQAFIYAIQCKFKKLCHLKSGREHKCFTISRKILPSEVKKL